MTIVYDSNREMETQDIHISSPNGEMIDTLQDVTVFLRLRIDGSPATGKYDWDWAMECDRLSSMAPYLTTLRDGVLKLTWLHERFLVDPLIDVQAQ